MCNNLWESIELIVCEIASGLELRSGVYLKNSDDRNSELTLFLWKIFSLHNVHYTKLTTNFQIPRSSFCMFRLLNLVFLRLV